MNLAFRIAELGLTTTDLGILSALKAQAEAGNTKPNYAALADDLERDASNVRRAALRLSDAGLFTIEPLALSDEALAFLTGESAGGAAEGGVVMVEHGRVHSSPLNPRKHFDEEALARLSASVGAKGIIQPLLVRPSTSRPGEYEIAAGERRWRSLGLAIEEDRAKHPLVPILVREMSDAELVTLAITENRDRADMHPLEEAEGYVKVQELRAAEGDEDKVTQELAEAAGYKDRRVIQKRIRLAKLLAPTVKEAFRRREITLGHANAVAGYPHKTQEEALPLMVEGHGWWGTGTGAARALREQAGLPVQYAIFEREAYDGDVIEDEETGELVYVDRVQAERLQRAAFKDQVKAFKSEGWAFVEPSDKARYGYVTGHTQVAAADAKPGGKVGMFVWLDERTLALVMKFYKKDSQSRTPPKKKPNPTSTDAPTEYEQRHWKQAATDRTVRLQAGIAAASPRVAMAITVVGMLKRETYSDEHAVRGWMEGRRMQGADVEVPRLAVLREEIEALGDAAKGLKIGRTEVGVTDEGAALRALVSAPNLERIFAAAVAAQCGAWPAFNARPGDSAAVRALVEMLGNGLPRFELTEDYLKAFTIPQLRRIAAAAIDAKAAEAMPAKKAKAVAFILEHEERNPDWCPPEAQYGTRAAVDKAVKAMLWPEKPKAKAKGKAKADAATDEKEAA